MTRTVRSTDLVSRPLAYRRGNEDEPPTIELALESGDEATVAWNQVRELGITVEALTAELKATRAALRQALHPIPPSRESGNESRKPGEPPFLKPEEWL